MWVLMYFVWDVMWRGVIYGVFVYGVMYNIWGVMFEGCC